ncbi:MAG: GLPGLI family protein [Bacteroidota bacterium]
MKKIWFSLCFLGLFMTLSAQQKVGTVIFERKINMYKLIQDEQMRAMMPEFRTSMHMLLFSDSVSVYKLIPEDESPDPFAGGGGGGRITMRFGGADGGDLYKNFTQSKSIQTSELGGKTFLITDSIRQQPWKLAGDTKQILGFNCHKATRKVTAPQMGRRITVSSGGGAPVVDTSAKNKPAPREMEIVAWFADDMISPVGPESYGQLPGVILELNIDNGATVYTAKEVKKTVDAKELKEPKKGKVVTQQEYMKLMQDLMSNQGGSGMRMRFDN